MADAPQLLLLDVPQSPQGPARAPRSRTSRRAPPITLELPLNRPRPAPLVVRAPPKPAEPMPPPVTFGTAKRLTTSARAALLDAFVELFEGSVRRGARVELRNAGVAEVTVSFTEAALVVSFATITLRTQWIGAVRELAREHGFIEPE